MKILIFAFACDPSAGSEPNYGFFLAAGLAEAGHQVCCITQSRGKGGIEAYMAQHSLPGLKFQYLDLLGRWPGFYHNQLGLYAFYLQWQRKAARLARSLDSAQDFDVVHHVTWGSFQMGTGAAYVGKPFVFGPVGGGQFALPVFKAYFTDGWRTEVMRKYVSQFLQIFNPMLRRTLHSPHVQVLACNAETLALGKHLKATRIAPYPDPALPLAVWQEDLPVKQHHGGRFNLVWAGRLSPRKGLKFTLMALAKVRADIPWHLTILGDGPQHDELTRWIAEYGLADRITRKGSIPWQQMPAEYKAADAFILTSLRESTGIQFLEAMAFGLPIFTLNMHGASIFVPEEAGYKIAITNLDDISNKLARAVETHYNSPESWPKLSGAARQAAHAHLWPQKIAYYQQLYKELLADTKK